MNNIKNMWIKLDPQKKRLVVIGLGLTFAVTILSNFLFVEPPEKTEKVAVNSLRLTGADPERFGIDAIERRIKKAEAENARLSAAVDKAANADDVKRITDQLKRDYLGKITLLEAQLKEEQKRAAAAKPALSKEQLTRLVQSELESTRNKQGATPDPEEVFNKKEMFQPPKPQDQVTPKVNIANGSVEKEEEVASFELIKIESSVKGPSEEATDLSGNSHFFPAGTILSGVLVTGLDAPTSMGSRAEPHPALLRIKKEALMPNFYTGDLEECFVLISGYGDMSSERAYLRSETLSCIDSEKNAVEMPLKSFAVGEDGSAGVRGILVSREGRLIAESLKAGTLSAMAEVFGKSPIPQIATGPAGEMQPFQDNLSSASLQSSAAKGAGAALERIADYYLDVADQIFPILEIRAGRQIDLVITEGADIAFSPN